MRYRFYTTISFLVMLLLLTSCTQSQTAASMPSLTPATIEPGSSSSTPQKPTVQGNIYIDAKLGFQLTVPLNWRAYPLPGSQMSPDTAAVTFAADEHSDHALIDIGVIQGSTMPAAFSKRGKPATRVGPYPAFVADRSLGQGRAPCLVRIFLAHEDYVLADWCAPDAFAARAQFEQVLATFQPAPSTFVSREKSAPAPQTCTGMQQQLGYTSAQWGKQLAVPSSAGWGQLGSGIFICSNEDSPDWYLFQCTELANRFLSERWGLPHLPGNAARYYDYYSDGVLQPGTIRTFPAGSYQLSSDASQGKSSFRPAAGDLLVFQDVNNPQVGWTSGLTESPGHVAVIVGVDNAHVYIAQENYSDTQYFLALPIRKVANGYEITDLSGWSHRIVRGWIHFTVNGGSL
jgi:hypothetical protein